MSLCSKPASREGRHGWYATHRVHVKQMVRNQANAIIFGDSIVAGLSRYTSVWDYHLKPLNVVNCGIGGDRTQNVLWRAGHLSLPDSVRVAVLLCGTNNMVHDRPFDIAQGIISCGTRLREKNPRLHVLVAGILPRGQNPSKLRGKIRLTNECLKKLCLEMPGFTFIEEVNCWTKPSGHLDEKLFYTDHLHLVKAGNQMLAMKLANAISVVLSNGTSDVTAYHHADSAHLNHAPSPSPSQLSSSTCSYRHHQPSAFSFSTSSSSITYHRCHRPRNSRSRSHSQPTTFASSSTLRTHTPKSHHMPQTSPLPPLPPSHHPLYRSSRRGMTVSRACWKLLLVYTFLYFGLFLNLGGTTFKDTGGSILENISNGRYEREGNLIEKNVSVFNGVYSFYKINNWGEFYMGRGGHEGPDPVPLENKEHKFLYNLNLLFGTLLYVLTVFSHAWLQPNKHCKYTYKEFKIFRLRRRSFSKRKTSLLPGKIILHFVILQNIFEIDTWKLNLKSIQTKDLFCTESIKLCKSISTSVLHEQLRSQILSKVNCKNHKTIFKLLLLLAGDIEVNPGPVKYPCVVCGRGVGGGGVYCTSCGFWVHPKCENMSNTEHQRLRKISPKDYNYTCSICVNDGSDDVAWDLLPFHDESLQVTAPFEDGASDEEDINLNFSDDRWIPFKKRGLHFIHLNINSLLSKIDELREIAKISRAAIIGISESKLDDTVLDGEISIEGFELVRSDRNRNGGGVACYIRSDISFNLRSDFSPDFENVFLDILLPKLKPILIGIIYRPPHQSGFLDKLSSAISNAKTFDSHEAYILGDFNLNLISKEKASNSLKTHKEFCSTHGLKQLIESPTRITENTSSLLDHILTNSYDKVSQAGVVDAGLSDHQIIYCTRKICKEKFSEHKDITIRSLKNYSQEVFLNSLREIDFPNYSQFTDVNLAYEDFIKKTTSVINRLAPEKKVRIKGSNQEWFDDEVLEAIRNRDKLFTRFKKTRLHGDKINYNKARNLAQRLIKNKKKDFVTGQLEQNIGKPKELWKKLKSMGLSAKTGSESKICLKNGEKISFDAKTNADAFCTFFTNLADDLLKKLPAPPKKFGIDTVKLYYQNQNLDGLNFTFSVTNEDTIQKLLQSINPSKAAGLDKLAGRFLKDGAPILATPITSICNLSIKLSIFPEKCKPAKLKPLFKKGSKTEEKNYRPISLLPLVSKIIEKVIHNQIEIFLEKHKIIYKYQSGFRKNHSTNSALAYLSNMVQKGFEEGNLTGMILIDLQKAFDTIDHEILLQKMNYIGFSQSTIDWFRSYLANRTFLVHVNGEYSKPGNLNCGVPQGSILGPLLFLLYVNDMSQAVSCELLLYADDSCLVFTDKHIDNIEDDLNRNFNSLCEWFVDNKLSIHFGEDKTKSILFGTKRKLKRLKELKIKHGDVEIKQHTQVKYLGCVLDSSLNGESMALQALSKINGKLKFLYRKQSFLSFPLRRLLSNALIQPHFDFACLAWYPCLTKKLNKKLQTAQNKCIRYCLSLGNRFHIGTTEFKAINWLPTKERFEQCVCTMIYKYFAGQAPAYISEMYFPVEQGRLTRRSFNRLWTPNQSTNRGLRTLSYMGPKIWNSLPNSLKATTTVNNFKHRLKELFFENLKKKEADPYVYY